MEDFVLEQTEILASLQGLPYTKDQIKNLLLKIITKGDSLKARSDLTKLLFKDGKQTLEFAKKEEFVNNFCEMLEYITSSRNPKIDVKSNNKSIFEKKFVDKKEDFPELEDVKLNSKRNKYTVLDSHYGQKLKEISEPCFCYGSKHPITNNCLECGRIMCLQEGENQCIECKAPLLTEIKYKKLLLSDESAQIANEHKDKLLAFQASFYSKMQVIDDFSDWYELSNNTWIDSSSREVAKKKDEQIDMKREKMDTYWKVNILEGTIETETEKFDELGNKEELRQFYNNEANKMLEKQDQDRKQQITEILSKLEESIPKKHLEKMKELNEKNVFYETKKAFDLIN